MSGDIVAAIVSSAALYAGAAAVSLPLLIHLLSKRRFHRIRWAAMEFLLEAERQNRRRIRIEQMILLALRCLAAFLIGLLLARWYVQPRGLAAVLGGAQRTERIVVLDDSFSMGRRSGNLAAFDIARSAVVRLARWIQQESPQDPLTVLLASRADRPVLSAVSLREGRGDEIPAILEHLRPSERGPCMHEAVASVRKFLDARSDAVDVAVYIVSDFQVREWILPTDAMSTGRATGPLAPLARWSDGRRSLRVVLLDVGDDAAPNTAITSLEADQPQVVAGVPAKFIARVTQYGRPDSAPDSLRVFLGEASQPPVPIPPIGPGQTVSVPIEATLPAPGPASLTVELPDDRLLADNRRHLALDVQRAVRTLLVLGTDETDASRDEPSMLAVAIRPEGPVYSGNEVDTIDEAALEEANLGAYHLVILANVYRITDAAVVQLERFAQAGGGIVFFLGERVDPSTYNRLLWRDGTGLLPARLGAPVEASSGGPGFSFADPDFTHPLLRNFANTDVPFFDGIVTKKFIAVAPAGAAGRAAASIPTSLPASVPADRAAARVVLAYEDADRHPAIVERPFGRGRVVLFTSSADKEWTNLPDWFTFVALTQELIQFAARPDPTAAGEVLVGSSIVMPLDPGRYASQVTIRSPAFPDEPEQTADARPQGPNGAPELLWSDTRRSGIYRFGLQEVTGSPAARLVAVNVDPRDSDLAHADEAALRQTAADVAFTYVRGADLVGEASGDARREMGPAVLIALTIVLLTESALAWWFGTSGMRTR